MTTACLLTLGPAACGSSEDAPASSDSATLERVEQAAVEKYRWHLGEDAQELVHLVRQMSDQIIAGELPQAQSSYAVSRVEYGQLEPAAVAFGPLGTTMNAQADELPADEFVGFHRIEKGLFADESTDGLEPVAEQLLDEVQKLSAEIGTSDLRAPRIVDATGEVLSEIATSKLDGEEEPYAHIDMVDVSASLEGTEAAFEAVRPRLASENQELVEQVEARFVDAFETLDEAGAAAREPGPQPRGSGFIGYVGFDPAQIRSYKKPVEALSELLEQASDEYPASPQSGD